MLEKRQAEGQRTNSIWQAKKTNFLSLFCFDLFLVIFPRLRQDFFAKLDLFSQSILLPLLAFDSFAEFRDVVLDRLAFLRLFLRQNRHVR